MKRFALLVVVSLFSATSFAQASEEEVPETTAQIEQMQAKMHAIREQMLQIQAAEDPEERRRLMQEHMQSMRESMMMMDQMMGGPMGQGRGQGAGPGAGGGRMQQCQQDDTQCRMDQMQMQQDIMGQQMAMMQQMMDQMMQQTLAEQTFDSDDAESHDEHH